MKITHLFRFELIAFVLGLLIFSCCSDDNSTDVSHDPVTSDIIENLLVEGFDYYEDYVSTMNKKDAREAALDELLKSDYVVSGEMVTQGIFLEFSDGSEAAIFTDGDDEPEHDTIPDLPSRISALQSNTIQNKSMPLNTRTIVLNPHYFQRWKYTNWLIRRYDEYFPKAGFEIPDCYINNACTLDRFASLDEYGIVHIYSHGCKAPDGSVYLLTGERVNATTTAKYMDDIEAGNIGKIFVGALGTVYMIKPEFIENHNNFSGKNTLVYGGFCHSYEGNWPDLCNVFNTDKSIAGYFGFDNSVYTSKNVEWANDLFSWLANPDTFNVPNVYDWRFNTKLGNSYDKNGGETVTIRYIGDSDLKLYKWENTIWNRTYYRFIIKVNAFLQKEDGTFIWEKDYLLHKCTGNGAFKDHKFTGKGYYYQNDGKKSVGNVTFSVDPVSLKISDFVISDTTSLSVYGLTERDEMLFKAKAIPYAGTTDPWTDGAIFSLKSQVIKEMCDSIYDYYFIKKDSIILSDTGWETIEVERTRKLLEATTNENSLITLELSTGVLK